MGKWCNFVWACAGIASLGACVDDQRLTLLGGACAVGSECDSGHCADRVCCDSACTGQCETCAAQPGVCSQASGAPAGSRPSCGGDGECAGACGASRTACDFPTVECRPQRCDGETLSLAARCDGRGTCTVSETGSCAPYVCGGDECGDSCGGDAQCAAGNFCNTGVCLATRPNGASCTTSLDCTSGFCVDGYCCNETCTGQCQACSVSAGICAPVTGVPVGSRPPCTTGASPVCNGSCDGIATDACQYPTGECSYCDSDFVFAVSVTGGVCSEGTCTDGTISNCDHYACTFDPISLLHRCWNSCRRDEDCGAAWTCIDGECN